jgi:hypothetical protein
MGHVDAGGLAHLANRHLLPDSHRIDLNLDALVDQQIYLTN